jgi:membrane-anchored mycosin MYCP
VLVRVARAAALTGVLACLPLIVSTTAAHAAGVPDCSAATGTDVAQHSHRHSQPLDLLDVGGAQRVASTGAADATPPGTGATVAVVDSGIATHGLVPVVASHSVGSATVRPSSYHGTAVAGLIAGPSRPGGLATGIAPGARIVDVQVYGYSADASRTPTATTEDLVAGLRWLTAQAHALQVDVAVVPLAVTPTPALASAVRALQRQGVLVVAPSGNRPEDAGPGYLSEYYRDLPGQDGFADIAPADLPGVLVAGTTAAGSTPAVNPGSIPNHAVDVVVPTAGGVSLALNGGDCLLTTPATSWAAAEVAGIAALLVQRYAGESPAQIAARIVDTASGTSPDGATESGRDASPDASLYFGAGVVQPVDALTRPLTQDGRAFSVLRAQPEATPPVRPPVAQADRLHHSRDVAVWAGLLAGAVVVVAAILRPLLSRRRSSG